MEDFSMTLGDRTYTDKKEAGTALIAFCKQVKTPNQPVQIGEYLGFKMNVVYDTFYQKFTLNLKGALTHSIEVGSDAFGNLTRINNVLDLTCMMQKLLTRLETGISLFSIQREVLIILFMAMITGNWMGVFMKIRI